MKNTIISLFIFFSFLPTFAAAPKASPLTASQKSTSLPATTTSQKIRYYNQGNLEKIIYEQNRTQTGDNALTFTQNSTLVDLSEPQTPLLKESVTVKDGELIEHVMEQLQINEVWELRVVENKLHYQIFKIVQGQKIPDDKEIVIVKPQNFINGPMIDLFVQKNWTELSTGQTLNLEFSVLEVSKPISFTLRKKGDGLRDQKKTLVLEMKPVSFVIRYLMDPIVMEFQLETKKLVYFKGRTPAKIKDGSKFKPFDAEILYSEMK